mgnify:CR=1 FL=1
MVRRQRSWPDLVQPNCAYWLILTALSFLYSPGKLCTSDNQYERLVLFHYIQRKDYLQDSCEFLIRCNLCRSHDDRLSPSHVGWHGNADIHIRASCDRHFLHGRTYYKYIHPKCGLCCEKFRTGNSDIRTIRGSLACSAGAFAGSDFGLSDSSPVTSGRAF